MRCLWLILALAACRSPDDPNLTGTWVGTATPSNGDFLVGGADVEAQLNESEAGAYFGSVTFDSDDGMITFDIGAQEPGNRIELFGQDVADVLEVRLLLDVKGDDRLEGTWTMGEIECPTTAADCTGSGSIGLTRQ